MFDFQLHKRSFRACGHNELCPYKGGVHWFTVIVDKINIIQQVCRLTQTVTSASFSMEYLHGKPAFSIFAVPLALKPEVAEGRWRTYIERRLLGLRFVPATSKSGSSKICQRQGNGRCPMWICINTASTTAVKATVACGRNRTYRRGLQRCPY